MGSAQLGAKKLHAVCVPFPAQGHVNPMMQLAKLLHSRGFHITFVNTEFNHRRLIRSRGPDSIKGLPDFQFATIPDGLPPSDKDATQDVPPLCDSTRKTCRGPFKELVTNLNCSSEVPQITCIVSDGIMGFGREVAKELGIPEVQFWTASACGFMAYLQYSELVKRGIVPFKDESFLQDGTLDKPVDWIPGMKNVRLKDIPSFIRVTDVNDIMFDFLGSEAQNCLKSSAIIFNTFNELEHEVLEEISAMFPNIYTIGPLALLDQHLREFAWGLANSKHHFLWIVRPDVVKGDSVVLPEEFFKAIKDRGYIASCGWNSTIETISEGVPVICWPFFAEQQTNCRFACSEWGIGMEVNNDVKRHEIEELVKEMLEGEKGRKMRQKAKEWKKKAMEATDIGGSSYNNFDRLIEQCLQ
ncbi:PREDICTED: UDP-glycosyltransferase 85A2-like [Fragaria vesca subsp. vesca]